MPEEYSNPQGSNFYSDSQSEPSADTSETSTESTGGKTALLPKSALTGQELKPGDEVTFKIVRVMDDQVEVEQAGSQGETTEAPPQETAAAAPMEPGAMSSMMQ